MAMNKPTESAYEFFSRDTEAQEAVKQMIESGKPSAVIADWLEEYMNQVDTRTKIKIYKALMVPVEEATHWTNLANYLIGDHVNAEYYY